MRHNRGGFTLLEAVVALAIIAMTSVGVLQAFAADLRGAGKVRDALTASTLARTRLARLEIATAADLAVLPDSLTRGKFSVPFDAFIWTADSRAVPGEPDLYDLHVTVVWPDGSTELRSRRFQRVPLVAGQ